MRASLINADGEIVNVIVFDDMCVAITQAEADAMPVEEFNAGNFYVVPDGLTLQPSAPGDQPVTDQTEEILP